jgi:soluble lytic murein transglycosylase-like protein
MMNRIADNYGQFIKFASDNSKLPKEVIASFIAVESGGNATAGTSGHITQGLMQWNRNFAQNTLEAEYRLGRLTPAEKDKLASFGIKFDSKGKTRPITNADQLKPELNILIGSILLGQMADSYFDGGKKQNVWAVDDNGALRLDRMIAVYNAGAYGSIGKAGRLGNYKTPLDMANAVPEPTKSYIKKILGVNGAMDVATSEVAPKFAKLG